jgi:hypothetical protein
MGKNIQLLVLKQLEGGSNVVILKHSIVIVLNSDVVL